jgi:serine/threonine protein kinase
MLPGVNRTGENGETTDLWASVSARPTAPASQTLAAGALSPFLRLIRILLDGCNAKEEDRKFFESPVALGDFFLTGQRPIVGVGHHFLVFASPYNRLDHKPPRVEVLGLNKEVYCIKSPNLASRDPSNAFLDEINETVLQELLVLRHPRLADHENIITLLGLDFQEDYDDHTVPWPCILLEYSDYGTLDAFQHDQGGLDPSLARQFLLDVGLALQSLHHCNIIHGDVKSENVLICKSNYRQYVAKLSDFGLAVINPKPDERHYLRGGTWMWSAPEFRDMLSVEELKSTDVYSLGLTLWRVFLNASNPYQSLDQNIADRYRLAGQELIAALKANPEFPAFVVRSIHASRLPRWAKDVAEVVIRSTICEVSAHRSLSRGLEALAGNDHTLLNRYDKSCAPCASRRYETFQMSLFKTDFTPVSSSRAMDWECSAANEIYWTSQASEDVLTTVCLNELLGDDEEARLKVRLVAGPFPRKLSSPASQTMDSSFAL